MSLVNVTTSPDCGCAAGAGAAACCAVTAEPNAAVAAIIASAKYFRTTMKGSLSRRSVGVGGLFVTDCLFYPESEPAFTLTIDVKVEQVIFYGRSKAVPFRFGTCPTGIRAISFKVAVSTTGTALSPAAAT